jgi:hypothetical protein
LVKFDINELDEESKIGLLMAIAGASVAFITVSGGVIYFFIRKEKFKIQVICVSRI